MSLDNYGKARVKSNVFFAMRTVAVLVVGVFMILGSVAIMTTILRALDRDDDLIAALLCGRGGSFIEAHLPVFATMCVLSALMIACTALIVGLIISKCKTVRDVYVKKYEELKSYRVVPRNFNNSTELQLIYVDMLSYSLMATVKSYQAHHGKLSKFFGKKFFTITVVVATVFAGAFIGAGLMTSVMMVGRLCGQNSGFDFFETVRSCCENNSSEPLKILFEDHSLAATFTIMAFVLSLMISIFFVVQSIRASVNSYRDKYTPGNNIGYAQVATVLSNLQDSTERVGGTYPHDFHQ